MLETILHTVPYAVGVCVCGGLAAHIGLKGLGRLNGYHIGLSIEPVDRDLEKGLDRENRIPRRRSGDERRAARALAEAKSRERTRNYLRQAKELDSETKRQFEDAMAKQDAAWRVWKTQDVYREAHERLSKAVRIAQERRKYQEARVEELDAIRAERKAAKAAAEREAENALAALRDAAKAAGMIEVTGPKNAAEERAMKARQQERKEQTAEEMLRDEQEETGGAEPASILDAAARLAEETEEGNLSGDRLVSV